MKETKGIDKVDTSKLRALYWDLEEAKLRLQAQLESVAKKAGCDLEKEQWTNSSDWITLIRIK